MRKLFAYLMIAVMIGGVLMFSRCEKIGNSQAKRIYKDSKEVKTIAEEYLKEKYGKDFVALGVDNPNHIYNSYAMSAYVADDKNKELFNVTVAFGDEVNYVVTDNYFIYSIRDDLEHWFKKLADPYIYSDFKVFYRDNGFTLPSAFKNCKTADDFLDVSTTSYYGIMFTILLPSSEKDRDFNETAENIAKAMLKERIRGQVSILIYEDEDIYEKINTRQDRQIFWSYPYKKWFYDSGVRSDFSLIKSDSNEGGKSGYRENLDN